jgi:hypothetical protein
MQINKILVYSPQASNRLKYVIDFINQQLSAGLSLTANKETYLIFEGTRINYSKEEIPADLWIQPFGLLEKTNIEEQDIHCFQLNGYPAFFKAAGNYPFDIFSGIFYLLSRYEEYLPHKKDMYGRYPHENSLAYRENFLQKPLINSWLKDFAVALTGDNSFLSHKAFSFLPTYDIDEAYSFKYKQWWRSRGGAIKDLLRSNTKRAAIRKKVLSGELADPFDSYNWMDNLHRKHILHPHYFFLVAGKTSKYDRNILPDQPAMQQLVADHASLYSLGLHPSWQSHGKLEVIKSEIKTLEKLSGQKIISSRQHFIKMDLPETYRLLIAAGILKDFSMGYGSINGFRASIASPFYWYDLEKEEQTSLLIYPFCFMEANSFFEQKQTPEQSLDELKYYHSVVKEAGGMLITIFHNTFLGTDPLFAGWREMYAEFIDTVS